MLGGGTIGILTALAAKVAGAGEIVVTDLFDFNLKVTNDLCGARTYSVKKDRLEDTLLIDYPDKFDITFLCSGAPKTVEQAIRLTQRGGRIVVVGMFLEPVPIELIAVNLNEIEIIGSAVYNHNDFERELEWIDSGRFDFWQLITHVLLIEKADDAMNLLIRHDENPIKILLAT